ncbi:hypothetical protein G9272_12005 [Streptomyces asoensis]|uniref:Uncharacterized protein n=1 Tax=Streptomyces asoensis TaxID=249586 RepID=A0A6M4WM05_9ACTN|nr:hypothetical protein [Streptomyces asoensis]QJT00942.1 hypothetical protein G9272_12005 [Streptomyces asoensis]
MEPWLIGAVVCVGLIATSFAMWLIVRRMRPASVVVDRIIIIGGNALAILTGLICAVFLPGGDGASADRKPPEPSWSQPAPEQPTAEVTSSPPASEVNADAVRHDDFDKFVTGVDEITIGDGNKFDLDSGRLNQADTDNDVWLSFASLQYGRQYRMDDTVRVGWINNDDLPDCAGRADFGEKLGQRISLHDEDHDWKTHSVCVRTTSGRWMLLRVLEGNRGAVDHRFRYGLLR